MAAGVLSDLCAGEHPRDLFNPRASIQSFNVNFRPPAHSFFPDQQVSISKPGNLRLVSHAKNLVRLRQFLKPGTYSLANSTAYPGIYFIEDDCARKLRGVRYSL